MHASRAGVPTTRTLTKERLLVAIDLEIVAYQDKSKPVPRAVEATLTPHSSDRYFWSADLRPRLEIWLGMDLGAFSVKHLRYSHRFSLYVFILVLYIISLVLLW